MYGLGQDSPPWLYRLPSILCGAASVAVAGRIGFRTSPAAGLVAALAVAVAFPFVNYGSEARGYGALILAMLVAMSAFDRALPLLGRPEAEPELRRQSWIMGLAVGLGALAHLEMLAGIAVLGLTAFGFALVGGARSEIPRRLFAAATLFLPPLLLILPAFAAVAAGISAHGLTFGALTRFEGAFVDGYGGLLASLAGLPATAPPWLALLLAAACLAAALMAGWLTTSRAALYVCGLVVAPAAIYFFNPPNLQYPRYFLFFGLIFVLLLADLAGRLWATRPGKAAVGAALVLFGLAQARPIATLARGGRGQMSALIEAMASQPRPTYASQIRPASEYVLDYYGRRAGITPRRVPEPQTCAAKPDFYVIGAPLDFAIAERKVTLGPQDCPTEYVETLDAPGSSLSGMHWRLFGRPDSAPAAQSAAGEH